MKKLMAYTDGSFDKHTGNYGYGCVIIDEENGIYKKTKGGGTDTYNAWNVTGEIQAVKVAINYALQHNYDEIIIYYDYAGIEQWANRGWKTNKSVSIEYVRFIDNARQSLNIKFVKVKAHTGNKHNEMADMLAKQGVAEENKL